jgi:hypothetical protein
MERRVMVQPERQNMPVISPTPGSVVWFHPNEHDVLGVNDQPLAASVAYVHNDRLINIGFLDRNGNHHARLKVVLLQDGDDVPATVNRMGRASYCEWTLPGHQGAIVGGVRKT